LFYKIFHLKIDSTLDLPQNHLVGWFLPSSLVLDATEEMLKGILSSKLVVHLHKETKNFIRGRSTEFIEENWFNGFSIVSVSVYEYL
jgi:hypothetical protein